eukprot:CAMPEP_0201690544 /NCGR_PEP_ID=MMETSP0578-20130828/3967_1 /ASSEMBLY_ACC=CAM_ASM_000663 /TAXON_ID=267565 /ORGANISM="Skeletonema grethea, Strain CCMP 1804" /LENGTH=65 /DNA_ID=CAMNT_0048175565 /DNA_START=147 /DNA_END=344 /DNA_ORIENTATION=+
MIVSSGEQMQSHFHSGRQFEPIALRSGAGAQLLKLKCLKTSIAIAILSHYPHDHEMKDDIAEAER